MSYLLASGCSFTDDNFHFYDQEARKFVETPWPKWPHFMAKEINLPYANVGLSGADNTLIFNGIYDYIYDAGEKPSVICVLLTEWIRMSIGQLTIIPFVQARKHVIEISKKEGYPTPFDDFWPEDKYDTSRDRERRRSIHRTKDQMALDLICDIFVREALKLKGEPLYKDYLLNLHNTTFRHIIHLIEYCKVYNIKLIIAQGIGIDRMEYYTSNVIKWIKRNGIDSIEPSLRDSFQRMREHWAKATPFCEKQMILNNPYFRSLEEEHTNNKNLSLLGWPWFPEFGGYRLCDSHYSPDWRGHLYIKNDGHPNEEGHKYLANYFINEYEKMI